MKRLFCFLIIFLAINLNGFSQPYPIPDGVQRIVFLGNSITYMGQFVSCVDAYLTLHYPEKHYEVINVGLPSETVSGLSEPNHAGGAFPRPDLHERLERVLASTKPDLVIACYGMNDGIGMPFDDERFQKYRDGINWLQEQIMNSGIPIILVTPPIYDERKGKAYANVIDIYADWLISCRYTKNWKVIDIHNPMKLYLEEKRTKDSSFVFAEDGVHPNDTGHFIMAKHILLGLGETEIQTATTIKNALSDFENSDTLLELVIKKQAIMKDAWLTHTGHKRPGMNKGLPLQEAFQQQNNINIQIQNLPKGRLQPVTTSSSD